MTSALLSRASRATRTGPTTTLVVGLVLLALLLRVGLVLGLGKYESPYHTSEHVDIATNLLAGKGYRFGWYGLGEAGEGSFMPPVYVGAVAGALALLPGAPWLALQLGQALLSALTVGLVFLIGRRLFRPQVGLAGAGLAALYPPSLGYVLDIQSVVIETGLVVAGVALLLVWAERPRWQAAALLGALLGLAILARSNLLLWLPLLGLWMLWRGGRRALPHLLLAGALMGAVLTPWVVRNGLLYGRFVLVSTNGGFNFFMGNNAHADGDVYARFPELWKQYPELAATLRPLNEAERDGRLFQAGLDFVQASPEALPPLMARKALYFWWFRPNFLAVGAANGYPWYFGAAYMLSYGGVLVLALVGLWVGLRQRRPLFPLASLFLVQTVTSMLFISGSRFRAILEPLLLVLAGAALVWAWEKIRLRILSPDF